MPVAEVLVGGDSEVIDNVDEGTDEVEQGGGEGVVVIVVEPEEFRDEYE